MNENRIRDLDHYLSCWHNIYSGSDKPQWEHVLPYYHENIHFIDPVQEIRGIKAFTEMTGRLTKRSKNLKLVIHDSSMTGDLIFIEWEMIISYKIFPKTSIFGVSRVTLNEGKIMYQRDYYDLWGDIFKNILFIKKAYRWFMKRSFG